jgi:hypothetical protein
MSSPFLYPPPPDPGAAAKERRQAVAPPWFSCWCVRSPEGERTAVKITGGGALCQPPRTAAAAASTVRSGKIFSLPRLAA